MNTNVSPRFALVGAAAWLFSIHALPAQWVSHPEPRKGFPAVYVDRSHEWLFAYDDLAAMLIPMGFDVFLSDRSLQSVTNLSAFAIVVVMNVATPSAFFAGEGDLLLNYVRQGGNLLLITKPGAPLEGLARALGFSVQPGRCPATERDARSGPIRVPIAHSYPLRQLPPQAEWR
jgi:hypothetical protein